MKTDYTDLADMVPPKPTLKEIADEYGVSVHAARLAARRRGINTTHKCMTTLRQKVEQMKPMEAVEFLLCAIEMLHPLASDQSHEIDRWGVHLTGQERRLVIALYEAPGLLTKEALLDALYFDAADVDSIPEIKIVDIFVCKARKKLPEFVSIETIWGRGYQLNVEEVPA